MKRSLIFLTSLGMFGAASPQSSVTMFGVLDTAVTGFKHQSTTPAGTTVDVTKSAMTSPALSRLDFAGRKTSAADWPAASGWKWGYLPTRAQAVRWTLARVLMWVFIASGIGKELQEPPQTPLQAFPEAPGIAPAPSRPKCKKWVPRLAFERCGGAGRGQFRVQDVSGTWRGVAFERP